jgi:hypothetical protein
MNSLATKSQPENPIKITLGMTLGQAERLYVVLRDQPVPHDLAEVREVLRVRLRHKPEETP